MICSKGFEKCVMTCIQHYRNIQNSFTALKILGIPPALPSLTSPWLPEPLAITHLFTIFTVLPLGFSCGSAGNECACNAGDVGLISGLRRSPGEGKGYLLQYSGLENSMDCIAHGVRKSRTWLSRFHFLVAVSIHSSSLFTAHYMDVP